MMIVFSFISLENFGEFLEKLFLKGLSPVLIVLLIYAYMNRAKLHFSLASKSTTFIISLILIDLVVRIIFTFLNFENSTRYFLIQLTFWILPATAGFSLLIDKVSRIKSYCKPVIFLVLIGWGAIGSSRPDRYRNELHEIAEIVKKDNNSNKYIYGDEKYYLEAARANYYAGIYRNVDAENQKGTFIFNNSAYYMAEKESEIFEGFKLDLIKKIVTSKKKDLFFYKLSNP